MITLQYNVRGVATLIQENKQMSDPMNPYVRQLSQLTKIRNKSDDIYWEIGKQEFTGFLYFDDATGLPCIPDYVWRGFFVSTGGASKKFKEGTMAKTGLVVQGNSVLEYDGPKDIDGMWDAGLYRVDMLPLGRGARVRRTRPEFKVGWVAKPIFEIDEDVVPDPINTVSKWMHFGGMRVGLQGWRPTHGRFKVEGYEVL